MASDSNGGRSRQPKAVVAGRWRICLLGAFSALNGDATLQRMPPTERRLLARLALAVADGGEQLSRAEVAAELWPDKSPDDARRCLSHAIATLGKALRSGSTSPLIATPRTLALLREAIDVDVVDFMDHVRAGNGSAARQSYGGLLLPGDRAPWVVAQRARLQTLFSGLNDAPVVTPAAPVRRHVPVYRSDFVGRDNEMEQILGVASSSRLVTVVGPGGCGKTRLMIEATRQLDRHDLILFVPLEQTVRGDSVLDKIRAARGLLARPHGLVDQLIADLQPYTSPLLLLDNLEQHVETPALALLSRLADGLPRLCVWASSRQPLSLPGESLVRVRPFPLPSGACTLKRASQAPAVDLFCRRARAAKRSFRLRDDNLAAVLALCTQLDGSPLAIEIAAARVRESSPAELLSSIAARRPLSRHGRALTQATSRHKSVEQTIEWSWDLLPLNLQEALTAFVVFRDGCTPERAALVAEMKPRAAQLALDRLCECSLVQAPDRVGGHYRVYQTIAEYVRAHTADTILRELEERHRKVFLATALEAVNSKRAIPADDVADVMQALATTAAKSPIDGARLAIALRTHWRAAGVTVQGLSILEQLPPQLPTNHPDTLAYLCLLARLLFEYGRGQLARTLAESALDQAGKDPARRAEALIACINVRSRFEGDPRSLDALCKESLILAHRANSASMVARALVQWGPVKIAIGDVAGARALFRSAVTEFEALNDEEGALGAIAGELACDEAEGCYAEMEGRVTRAYERASDLGHVELQLLMLNRLGCCADGLNQPARALEIYRRQAALARTVGLEYHFAIAIWNQCLPLVRQGQYEDAACLMAFSERYWKSRVGRLSPADQATVDSVRSAVVEHCGQSVWIQSFRRGKRMSWAEGISLGLGDVRSDR